MKTRKIFWFSVTAFSVIIIGAVLYMNALSFERLFPLDCDVSEEWLRGKTDFLVVKNFLDNHPDSKFNNLGNMENMPRYCQYEFVEEKQGDAKRLKITMDENMQLVRITADSGEGNEN
ncbi:hypothetical protein C6990_09530 [Nitrosopumilus sp. b3]|uniref:hypothetical protein n=1 Tax=Nitrosopumilus sp. b3 TaxID=2109909 RepID=UPI0015F54323|nr:hypothetical protein [Nitrosopumilus sp. b3]KAF6246358.1 hypothetical protein C6990_09530 [Nitrosopumilus sp. b3]